MAGVMWLPRRLPSPSALALLFACLSTESCSSDACERQDDCAADEICSSSGACVARPDPGPRPRFDAGRGDLGVPETGARDAGDAGARDAGPPDASDGGARDAGRPDAGDAGARDGGALPSAPEGFVRVRILDLGGPQETRLRAVLQDLSGADVEETEMTVPAPGASCVLRERRVRAGLPRAIFTPAVLIAAEDTPTVVYRLVGDALGIYAVSPLATALTNAGEDVRFEIEAAPAGSPSPALSGIGPVLVPTPAAPSGLRPSPALPLALSSTTDFRWTPSGASGASVVFELATVIGDRLRATCVVPDNGAFTLPGNLTLTFRNRLGAREAELLVYRVEAARRDVGLLAGGQVSVELRVENGARYRLR